MSNGLLVRVHAGSEEAPFLERELAAAVAAGSPTTGSVAVRFRRGDYAAFAPMAAEDPLTETVGQRIEPLLSTPVEREAVDVLAAKPLRPQSEWVTKAALLTFAHGPEHDPCLEDLLAPEPELREEECTPTAWYAFQLPDGGLGLFDLFPTSWARVRHLRELVRHDVGGWGRSLLGGFPGLHLLDVVAATPGIRQSERAAPGGPAARAAEQAAKDAMD
jgi:hypothetical protein